MEKEVLVKVEGLSKKFSKSLKKSLKYGVYDLVANLRGKESSDHLRPEEFWALKDINFEVRRGECLGLIGHNGAGKSTLLKILNGLINPDHGKVTMHGRVGALIELGAGFNPIMTGRENIYNNGAVLGFSKKEIDQKIEEIIDFAEIREFIDMPVQNYSSGMKIRLGFAVAAQMEPDILIIDEVLAVGDLGFVLKCFKQIDTILANTAIIFVSHSMPMISRICTQAILLEKGKAQFQGIDVGKAIDIYYSRFSENESNVVFTDNSINFKEVHIKSDLNDVGINMLNWKDDIVVDLSFENIKLSELPYIVLTIYDKEQREVAMFQSRFDFCKIEKGQLLVSIIHSNLQLSKGLYSLSLNVGKNWGTNPLLRVNNIITFQVVHDRETWSPFLLDSDLKVQ
ncbi:ABC transporter ATP-binding protein [uncultured Dokdonia sp.]|uniref:ABC transporter ATP-binding protein n=1 Tax=uncultured Dokdonia sp. TaxID=575653 RepID=UPI0030EE06CA|tara:strand:+ start:41019 stop:42212 length:1194 start_codon:yes stop_codon:yes gene_type:complete